MSWTWILIMFVTNSSQYGVTAISQEFASRENCQAAGTALAAGAAKDRSHVIVWGCYAK